jgi:hypothetical protein
MEASEGSKLKMKNQMILLAITIAVLLTANCAVGPVHGVLYTGTKFAGEFNPANDVPATKNARGCQHMVLGLVAIGKAGAGDVAQANGIKRIAHVDHETMTVLELVYGRYCTTVYGD